MRFTLSFLFLSLSFSYFSAQEVHKESIKRTIDLDQIQHPYIYFDQNDLAEIKNRIQNDRESGQIMDRLTAEANMLLHMPIDVHVPVRGSNVRAGWSTTDRANEYEKKMSSYANHAFELAFVFQITKQKKYAQKAFEFAEMVCRMPVWILQAHEFPIIYSRVMPWNVPDNQVNFNFDIRTASIGEKIGCMYDWTYEVLDDSQRDRIRGALLEKVITPVRGDYEFHWWATSYRCNWTGVCNGGLGVTALALLKDYPSLIDVVTESYNRINRMMDEIGIDGGWQEGGSYLHYGLHHATRFGYALKRMSQSQYNLFNHSRLSSNPASFISYLFIPPNRAVNFGDSRDRRIGSTDFFNLITNETNSAEGAWYRDKVLGEGRNLYDLIFPRPKIDGSPPSEPSRHFRTIDWWVMRSDFSDENKVVLAGKAGKNNDPHHGHLDIGHFVLFWKGLAYIKDSGQPYYDEKYFDEARWDYPHAGSSGHNVISVNGEQQISGKLKNQDFNHEIGGKVLEFTSSDQRDYVWMDPTNAYPKKELKRWYRHIILEKPQISIILDDIESQAEGAAIDIRFHSEAKEQIHENGFVLLTSEDTQMALIPISKNPIQFDQGQHAYQPVHATRSFQWLPYFGTQSQAVQKKSVIAHIIVPVKNEGEAKSIQSSTSLVDEIDSIQIKFEYRGKSYSYDFVPKENGLGLE